MEKIVVVKLVRLGKDGDNFSKDLIAKEERTNVKVHIDYMNEMNANWKTSGRLYIIDEKATKERDEKVYWASLSDKEKAEIKKADDEKVEKLKTEKDAKDKRAKLLLEADALKLEFPKNIPSDKLEKMIDEAKKINGGG